MKTLADFLAELKRRRVFRVAAVYACVAFIIVQIVDGTFESIGIPIWGERLVFALLAIGFPIAVALAWAFDITDKGIVRTKPKRETAVKAPPHPLVGNKTLAVIAVLAIIVAVWALLNEPSPGGAAIRSIAVLPLDNISGDPEEDSIVDGMHEALISELCGISAITVISRQSTLQYKESDKTMPVIASELGVDALVEGSAQLEGNRVRITAQLIDSQDHHLWQNTYDRNLEDVFALYDDVTRAIVQEIRATLTPEEEERLASAPQVNPEAYELYLKGWHFRTLETPESLPLAVAYLEQAVAIDPTFAPAWAALSPSYNMARAVSGWDPDSTINLRREALAKALELDPNNVLTLTELGVTQSGDNNSATAAFRRALDLGPSNVNARYEYGLFLMRWGQFNEGLAELKQAQELDPVNPLPPYGLAIVYGNIRKYDKAQEYAQAALELAPDHAGALLIVKWTEVGILIEQSRFAEAAAVAAKAYAETTSLRYYYRWLLLCAEGPQGNRDNIYAIRDSLINAGIWPQQEQENPYQYAHLYAVMGEKEQALDLLDIASESAYIGHAEVLYNPEFDFLRAEPRFKALMQKLELTEVFDENGNLIQPLDENLQAYNAPGSR